MKSTSVSSSASPIFLDKQLLIAALLESFKACDDFGYECLMYFSLNFLSRTSDLRSLSPADTAAFLLASTNNPLDIVSNSRSLLLVLELSAWKAGLTGAPPLLALMSISFLMCS